MKILGGARIKHLTYIPDVFYGEKKLNASKKYIDTLNSSIREAYIDKFQLKKN